MFYYCLDKKAERESVCVHSFQVPFHCLGQVQHSVKFFQQGGLRLEDDYVVDHHGNQHHHHLQLVVDPQEHRARHQTQYTAVDKVLTTEREVT